MFRSRFLSLTDAYPFLPSSAPSGVFLPFLPGAAGCATADAAGFFEPVGLLDLDDLGDLAEGDLFLGDDLGDRFPPSLTEVISVVDFSAVEESFSPTSGISSGFLSYNRTTTWLKKKRQVLKMTG